MIFFSKLILICLGYKHLLFQIFDEFNFWYKMGQKYKYMQRYQNLSEADESSPLKTYKKFKK